MILTHWDIALNDNLEIGRSVSQPQDYSQPHPFDAYDTEQIQALIIPTVFAPLIVTAVSSSPSPITTVDAEALELSSLIFPRRETDTRKTRYSSLSSTY